MEKRAKGFAVVIMIVFVILIASIATAKNNSGARTSHNEPDYTPEKVMYKVKAKTRNISIIITNDPGRSYCYTYEFYDKIYKEELRNKTTGDKEYTFKKLLPGKKYIVKVTPEYIKDGDSWKGDTVSKKVETEYDSRYKIYKTNKQASDAIWKSIKQRKKYVTVFILEKKANKTAAELLDDALSNKRNGHYVRSNMKISASDIYGFRDSDETLYINGKDVYGFKFCFKYYLSKKREKEAMFLISKKAVELKIIGSARKKARRIANYCHGLKQYKGRKAEGGTAYYALTRGQATCNSRAALFYMICKKIGVPARIVTCNAHGSKGFGHKFNMVKTDGKWKFIDVHEGNYFVDIDR